MKDNYADFERLLGAKLAEIQARMESLGSGAPPVAVPSAHADGSAPAINVRKYDKIKSI